MCYQKGTFELDLVGWLKVTERQDGEECFRQRDQQEDT